VFPRATGYWYTYIDYKAMEPPAQTFSAGRVLITYTKRVE